MNVLERTMQGIINAMASGGWVRHTDIRAAVIAAGGRTSRIGQATKRLRNMGFPIVVDKRRHLTTWRMDPNDPEQEQYHDRVLAEAYSEILTLWKALVGAQAQAPAMATFRAIRDVENSVGAIGRAMGKTFAEIGADTVVAVNTTGRTP
jgi:hypothetical protein